MHLNRMFVPGMIEFRAAEGDKPARIAGYAAVYYDGSPGSEFRIAPSLVERIAPGAFDETIGRDDVRGLFNHDPNMVLGRTSSRTMRISADAKGLAYEIDLPDTQAGRDVGVIVGRHDVQGSSFAFSIPKGGEDWVDEPSRSIVTITRIERLFDVGPVTFPAYEGTSTEIRSNTESRLLQYAERIAIKARVREHELLMQLRVQELKVSRG